MSRRDATLHDVARAVGVSTRTVSRVVRGETGFSAETERRVREAIDTLGYRPNLLARGLISGRSGTIGLVGAEMSDPFFPELADGVQRAASDLGLTMFFASTDNNADRQKAVLDSLMSHGVDGVLLFPTHGTDQQLRSFADQGLQMVSIDHDASPHGIASVSSDIEAGARLAVAHLLATGRTRVAHIGNGAVTAGRRRRGYVDALDGGEVIVETGPVTAAGGMEAMTRILADHPDVDGVFAYNDLMAIGALRALGLAGRSVPADVALVGFDDIGMSAQLTPALTTIRLDRVRLGREALARLRQVIDGAPSELSTVIEVELIERETT